MSQHWPNNTACLPPDGTHRVEQRNDTHPKARLFLRAPKSPIEVPFWTTAIEGAGVWSEADAKLLAGVHSGIRTDRDGIAEAWAVLVDDWLILLYEKGSGSSLPKIESFAEFESFIIRARAVVRDKDHFNKIEFKVPQSSEAWQRDMITDLGYKPVFR